MAIRCFRGGPGYYGRRSIWIAKGDVAVELSDRRVVHDRSLEDLAAILPQLEAINVEQAYEEIGRWMAGITGLQELLEEETE